MTECMGSYQIVIKFYYTCIKGIKARRGMLEGCVTVVYAGATLSFAGLFVAASLGGWRHRLARVDSLWGLLLTLICAVYAATMLLSLQDSRACEGWL